nr:IucA/IucC family siderophore biosynthesis protein [Psychromicrobium silvestre]
MLADYLTPERWQRANRHLVRKAIAEFSHERLLQPVHCGEHYELRSPAGDLYRFEAQRMRLEHWSIDEVTLNRFAAAGEPLELDALEFITDFSEVLGINPVQLPIYLEEISSTLSSHAFKQSHSTLSSAELAAGQGVEAFQSIERSMTEGHPCFVANNGRLGFGGSDFLAFAPETGAAVRLVWVAVARSHAIFSSVSGLSYQALMEAEFDGDQRQSFEVALRGRGLEPEDYYLMPVHPWQWDNKLQVTFAAEIAQQRIVFLGHSHDDYQAQQSIRTFFNTSVPQRNYVKTAISVLNMGFMRGLSPEYMAATPAINDWVHSLVAQDEVLQARGLVILREVAAVGYHNRYFEAAAPKGSAYRKMFSALWRESPLPQLAEGETLATMASLLHLDGQGKSLVGALIARSGLHAEDWLRCYLRCYLQPLVHCLVKYELAFMPHGENVILVLRHGVPVRAIMKDIAEEIVLMGEGVEVPEAVHRVKQQIPESERVLAIFTDVFDCIFRFLAEILQREGLLSEEAFWALVAESIRDYRSEVLGKQPELVEAFERHNLFAEEFDFSCLNRLQLRNNQQMLDLTDPSGGLQFSGKLANPMV